MANAVQGQVQKPMTMRNGAGGVGRPKMGMGAGPKKSKKGLWWTLGIVFLLVIIGLVWWLV